MQAIDAHNQSIAGEKAAKVKNRVKKDDEWKPKPRGQWQPRGEWEDKYNKKRGWCVPPILH